MKTLKFYGKTSDCFGMHVYDKDGKQLISSDRGGYDGYPPNFLGHDGIELEIDIETGQILNWNAAKAKEELQELIQETDEEEDDL